MTAPTAVVASQAVITAGDDPDVTSLECQLTQYTHEWAEDVSNLTTYYTACPEGTVSVPGAPSTAGVATGTLSLLMDWSDSGWSWKMAALGNTLVSLVVNLDTDKPTQARSYTGTVLMPRIPESWIVREAQTGDLAVVWQTCVGPTRYVAP